MGGARGGCVCQFHRLAEKQSKIPYWRLGEGVMTIGDIGNGPVQLGWDVPLQKWWRFHAFTFHLFIHPTDIC